MPLKWSNTKKSHKKVGKIKNFEIKIIVKIKTWFVIDDMMWIYGSRLYAMFGKCSMKSVVFSFGVLIWEIVNGKKNTYLIS